MYVTLCVVAAVCVSGARSSAVGVHPSVQSGIPRNPGAKLRMTHKALQHLNQVGVRVLTRALWKVSIPRLSSRFPNGRGDITMWNIRFSNVKPPSFSAFKLSRPDEINWHMYDASMRVIGDVTGNYRIIGSVQLRGQMEITANKIQLTMTNRLGRDMHGKPIIKNVACKATVGEVAVAHHNGGLFGWGVRLFQQTAVDQARPILQDQLCSGLKRLVDLEINEQLRKTPTVFPVTEISETFLTSFLNSSTKTPKGKVSISFFDVGRPIVTGSLVKRSRSHGLWIDYSLKTKPIVGRGFIETRHKGEVSWGGKGSTPFYPIIMRSESLFIPSRMFYAYVSDYTPNSMMYHAYMNNMLNVLVKQGNATLFGKYLRLTCGFLDMCLGNIILSLAEKYPVGKVELVFHPSRAPAFIFTQNGSITIYVEGNIIVFVRPRPRMKRELIVQMAVKAKSIVEDIKIQNYRVYGRVSIREIKTKLRRTTLPDVDDQVLEELGDFASQILEEAINAFMSKGLPLPNVTGLKLINPEVSMENRFMRIATDIQFDERLVSQIAERSLPRHLRRIQ